MIAIVVGTLLAAISPRQPPQPRPAAPPRARVPARGVPARVIQPTLSFPDPGLDDSAAYDGYQTRLFRDAADNTVQVYVNGRAGRVVHVLADAENASVAFTARDSAGQPAVLRWAGSGATVARGADRGPAHGHTFSRAFTYQLVSAAPLTRVGLFTLGSMRVEREFQDEKRHLVAFGGAPYRIAQFDTLVDALGQLPPAEQRRHLAALGAADREALRARVLPQLMMRARSGADGQYVARVVQPTLDGGDTLALELRVDARRATTTRSGDVFVLRARRAGYTDGVPFTVTVMTTGRALTPLRRDEIFAPTFLDYVARARDAAAAVSAGDSARLQARVLERQVRGVELLASREQFMAGLPTYATYFGRDQLMTALMMRPIWRATSLEVVIGSVLRGLSAEGAVSHEESVGQQAVREAAAEYATFVGASARATRAGDTRSADSLLARARTALAERRRTRENYVMVDTDFQLPVLVARWITDPAIPAPEKRAFLLGAAGGAPGDTRLTRLLRALARVARRTAPYVANPVVTNLVDFPSPSPGQYTGLSWRDSRVGYANGKYAYDVNAIWAPHALESIGRIVRSLADIGVPASALLSAREFAAGTAAGTYARDPAALARAVTVWQTAERHFVVRLGPAAVRTAVAARIAALPPAERAYWTARVAHSNADHDSLTFVGVALDEFGHPIGIANSDPSTRLFLGDTESAVALADSGDAQRTRRDVGLFVRDYPVGLYVDRVGPVVANDAYAPAPVWEAFAHDPYHGPRVVWGREANLFVLGMANRIAAAPASAAAPEFRSAMLRVRAAVAASGFRSELWSYEIRDGRPVAIRYGTAGDVQLWSMSDLAVEFALARLPR